MFMAALLTIAKIWKPTKCPPRDKWIKVIYTYIYIHFFKYTYMYLYIFTHTHWNMTQP